VRDIRYVVIHSPGPNWQKGVPLFEQDGLHHHIEHYRTLFADGKLVLGGPFMDEQAGGMMIPEQSLGESEIAAFAAADPAVASGLLTFEVRAWLIGMHKQAVAPSGV
jgi:uncharacterized protein YciI